MEKPVQRVAVIMAGGSGERFWPLSRQTRPKQLLKLTSDTETLLEEAVNRVTPLIPPEHVFVATSRVLAPAIRQAELSIPDENVLAEPDKRNTAGCLCWVAAQLRVRYPEQEVSIAVLTADHLIQAPDRFLRTVDTAMKTAEQQDVLVTIGIKPTRAETGYGYIEAERGQGTVHLVKSFREKPDAENAARFVEAGNFFWNSGMFFWRLGTFTSQLCSASPAHEMAIRGMTEWLSKKDEAKAEEAFKGLPDISIDYALMEKADKVMVVESDFPWDDVGAWDSLARSRKPDASGNILDGDPIVLDAHDCIVLNESGNDKMAVGVVGVENLVVVVSEDAVLVVPKDQAQRVKDVVKELKKRKAEQL